MSIEAKHRNVPHFAVESLTQNVGQMIMVGFRGAASNELEPILRQIRELNLGGVILFDRDVPGGYLGRNIRSLEQVAELTRTLQEAAAAPLLIAVDQEGGQVVRLRPEHGFPAVPSARKLGEEDSAETVLQTSRTIAAALRRAGINLNFAPCVDLDRNPENPIIAMRERSFGSDPFRVARLAEAFIRGHRENGVLCCLKHFPGHGSSQHDSHLGIADVTGLWSQDELIPYRELILHQAVDMVMTAHIFHRQWDEERPASLSPFVIDNLLRRELRFDGVVVTDDLQMAAVSNQFSIRETVASAVRAGADLLLFANNSVFDPDIAFKIHDILVELIQTDNLGAERVACALARIAKLKSRLSIQS
ncbi:MAG: beta-N-acetylhexosaminidase [candidate division KSB1 bacterium]|nr:beta-N-acetylhexosaminidase [candidate division KSB1 bacterium]